VVFVYFCLLVVVFVCQTDYTFEVHGLGFTVLQVVIACALRACFCTPAVPHSVVKQ